VKVTLPGQYDPLVSGSDVNRICCAPILPWQIPNQITIRAGVHY